MSHPLPEPESDPTRRFVSGAVERRASLSRAEYLEEYAGRKPVLLAGAAKETEAVRRWGPDYLIDKAGEARLDMLSGVYERRAREAGYPDVHDVVTNVREVVEALLADDPSKGYLFNNPSSVMRDSSGRREFEIGWKDGANPGLAALDADFRLPGFLRDEDLIQASLIIGGHLHSAPLHYDLGGEAKALVQVYGRKRVLLFHPENARFLYFPGWFDPPQPFRVPHASEVDLHRPDFGRFPELERARCLEVDLEPGDVLYWPPFWAHDVTNLDRFTLAVSCSCAELGASSMMMRESLGLLGRLFLNAAREGAPPRPEVDEAFRRLEELVMADELRELETFWGWHARVFGA